MTQLTEISKALSQLSVRVAKLAASTNGGNGNGRVAARKGGMSIAALKLHGQYLGYTHHLSKKERATIRKVRMVEGVRAAIKAAQRVGK